MQGSGKTLGDIITVLWNDALRPAIIFLFIAATVVFMAGIVRYLAGADSEEARETGKKHILWGIVGMTIMFATGAIMTVLQNFFKSL